MAGKSRQSANLVSDKNIFVDVTTDNTGIGTTSPKTKLDVLGDVAVSGILTVGISSSITIDGNSGIISATTFYGDGSGLANIGLTGIDDIEDVNLSANNAPSDGRALIYQNGEWIAGPVIGGYDYVTVGEPFFNNVSLLLHMNGVNGSTTFTDSSNNNFTATAYGNARISSLDSKFGGSSGFFDGNGDYLDLPASSAFNFGTGDFTVEFWFKSSSSASGTTPYRRLMAHPASTNAGNTFQIWQPGDTSNGGIIDTLGLAEFGGTGVIVSTVTPIADSLWHHIAFVRKTGITRCFLDGILKQSANDTNDYSRGGVEGIRIGSRGDLSSTTFIHGYIDELRITKGVARYETNFSVQTEEFSEGVETESKGYIIDNLDDVDTSTTPPSNGQSLVWNSATQLWRPSSSSIYSQTSGFSTNSSSASYAQTSGFSTSSGYAEISGFSTISSGLTTTASVNTTGIITASQFTGVFLGDGSGLTNIVATGSGVEVRDDGNLVGVARTLDFGDNLNVEFSSGIITVSAPPSSYFVKTSAGIHTLDKVGIGTTNPVSSLDIFGNVNVAGTSGQLFSVTDNLSTGSIFSVNDISGIPSIDVDANGTIGLAPYNGRIGIGTTNPGAALDILTSGLPLRLSTRGSNPGYSYVQFGRSSTVSQNWHFGSEGNQYFNVWNGNFGSGIGPLLSLYSPGSTTNHAVLINYSFGAAPTGTPNQPLQVNGGSYISGNVGIGIALPVQKLHVVGNAYITERLGIANPNPNLVIGTSHVAVGNFLAIYNGSVVSPAPSVPSIRGSLANNLVLSGGNGGAVYINNDNGSNGLFVNAGGGSTTWFRIDSTGRVGINTSIPVQNLDVIGNAVISNNLGIGTTNPQFKLQVDGPAFASSFISTSFIGDLTGTATTALTLTDTSDINTTGVITATKFIGDGSGLSGIVATSGGGVFLQNDSITIGAASTINFSSDFAVTSSDGVGVVTIASAPTLSPNSSVNTTGIITAAKFVGDGSGLTNVSGGGGGASSRTVVSGITTEIPVNGIGNTEIAGFKTYGIMKVGLSTAAWIRLYTDSVSRDNDINRPISNDPTAGSGLVAEIATAGLSTVKITPFVVGFNDDDPVTNTIYISIKNLSGIATNVSFDLTILKLEE